MIYNVTINDKVYEVEVEKGKANLIKTTAVVAAAPAAAPAPSAAPAAAPASRAPPPPPPPPPPSPPRCCPGPRRCSRCRCCCRHNTC